MFVINNDMAFHSTLVPAPSGQPDARYTESYLETFINTTVGSGTLIQILENRGSNLILIWED
jgi:hypothetical protein